VADLLKRLLAEKMRGISERARQVPLIAEHPGVEIPGTKFGDGNGDDGKHYWITPPDLMARLQAEFGFTFDACPHPVPQGFDGLVDPWGASTYVNPPFGSIIHQGKKKGPSEKGHSRGAAG
jgi:hypothetical protein